MKGGGYNKLTLGIYPNPATGMTTVRFDAESTGIMAFRIIDLKGQVVYRKDLGTLPKGENRSILDLSGLESGIYTCQLTNNGHITGSSKLIIAR